MRNLIICLALTISLVDISKAETLSFNHILEKAKENSFDLKMSTLDINISKTKIKEAKADYYPILSVNYTNQYDRDLANGSSPLTQVGDSTVVNSTKYVNALYAGMQYNLYDFGIRKQKLIIAQKDTSQKEVTYEKNLRDLKLNLADLYTKALLTSRELAVNNELLKLNKTIFSMFEQLYDNGFSRKTDMTEQAIKVATQINKNDELISELNKSLKDLSYYTNEDYSTADRFLNMSEDIKENSESEEEKFYKVHNIEPIKLEVKKSELINELDEKNIPEYKQYQLEIEKKKAELSALKRQNLPQFRFYTNYYFYGTDPNNYFQSFSDMDSRSITFRVTSTVPVFDGLKNQAQRERAKLEIERLNMELSKKIETVRNMYEKAYDETQYANQKLENQANALKITEEKLAMLEKLNDEQLIDKISFLKQKTELIAQQFELEKTIINTENATYKLKVLTDSENMAEEPANNIQPKAEELPPVEEESPAEQISAPITEEIKELPVETPQENNEIINLQADTNTQAAEPSEQPVETLQENE